MLTGWVGGGTWYWVCQVRDLCEPQPATQAPVAPAFQIDPLRVLYGDTTLYEAADNFRFARSAAQGRTAAAVSTLLDSVAAHLAAHPGRDIEITADYAPGEAAAQGYSNLGLGRAAFVADALLSRGVDPARIIKLPRRGTDSLLFARGDTLFGGVALRILDRESAALPADSLATGQVPAPAPVFESRNLYFAFNSFDLDLDEDMRDYITRTIQYLRGRPDQRLVLTGHTDNVGTAATNRALGLDRAGTIRQFFVEFGLDAAQIETRSEGMKRPIAPNDTEEGRARNRRVEIAVQ
ncbi:MAG: hypothetical protein OHK0039_36700 [Bacteroidia bacterium]